MTENYQRSGPAFSFNIFCSFFSKYIFNGFGERMAFELGIDIKKNKC